MGYFFEDGNFDKNHRDPFTARSRCISCPQLLDRDHTCSGRNTGNTQRNKATLCFSSDLGILAECILIFSPLAAGSLLY